MTTARIRKLLQDLGLNQLEADIYIFLLSQEPMTAYKIAKHIGRPAANVYKAVETLARKGALTLDDGSSRLCRAVPARSFLKRAEQDFRDLSLEARTLLTEIEAAPVGEHIHRVDSVRRVYAYCREMLHKAKAVVVIDAFPAPLERIAPLVAQTARRGVEVFVEAYAPLSIKGASVAYAPSAADVVRHWSAQQLNVVVDGKESLMALLSHDGTDVLQAYWSNSLYLSCAHHGGRLCEQTIVRALEADKQGGAAEEVVRILRGHAFFQNSAVPGQQELVRRYAMRKE